MVKIYFKGSLKEIFPGEYSMEIQDKVPFKEILEKLHHKFGNPVYQYLHRPNGITESPSLIIIKRNNKLTQGAFASEILEEMIEPNDEILVLSVIAGG
ncbi:MAG: hypothetical protein OH319_03230 [Candidatus Parvarchaeota archaeon]|nr:hypothetical protein [Candidatus Jingweiarchaeum tengchongense]MCW1298508.1 hypothetical protein [Candidatus Jingweiarchaeum tengchongense]MCW1300246.1 hypothetical protein [Candidatus Jingweiarchaeum tengchongense]MCW1304520.1 hypothetical protein [Candidatus Jingweiarchaeum tengchongense]MCW1305752.1 hypothetical protein [Candidatus Jingweiarchaeum tengchongense]